MDAACRTTGLKLLVYEAVAEGLKLPLHAALKRQSATFMRKRRVADKWLAVAVRQVSLFVDRAREPGQVRKRCGADKRVAHLDLRDRNYGGRVVGEQIER